MLQGILGKLISFYRSTGPVSRVMTRATYRLIAQAKTWHSSVTLDEFSGRELIWWLMNIDEISGFTMKTDPSVLVLSYNYVFHGDASGTGLFLGMIRDKKITLLSQPFSPEDCLKSSTFREVSVFWGFYMKSNLEPFKNSSIHHYTDS